ncbi:Enoyl-CoA hydratase/isomerase [Actinobacteria bacterium OK074]|nr:Enoyl-CoA hydratase/isomerase [Actinobacteria bacterium OK074]
MSSGSTHDTATADGRGEDDDGLGEDDVSLTIGGSQPLTPELIVAVEALCTRVEDASGDPVVVLRLGAPPAGAAPERAAVPVAIHLVNRWERALRRLERVNAVTLAVAEGRCGGPALEAMLSCDYRIGGPDLRLAPSSGTGEPWPGMAVHRLANQLGVAKVRQLVLFGTELPAVRALEVGLVDELSDDLPAALTARLALARGLTGTEIAIRRRLLLEATSTSFEDALGTHLAACDRTLRRLQESSTS